MRGDAGAPNCGGHGVRAGGGGGCHTNEACERFVLRHNGEMTACSHVCHHPVYNLLFNLSRVNRAREHFALCIDNDGGVMGVLGGFNKTKQHWWICIKESCSVARKAHTHRIAYGGSWLLL